MNDEKIIGDIRVRPQEDGTTLYDIPIPKPEIGQTIKIVVNRGKGNEEHTEQG